MVRLSVLILFSLLMFPVIAQAKSRVLLIESYHVDHPWDVNFSKGLSGVLKDRCELIRFAMDTKRLKVDKYPERAELAWQKYLDTKPDIVVLADDNALKLLGKRFLETETPVVYMGINENPRKYIPLNRNITGVLERPLYKRTVLYIKQLLYIGSGKVLILFDESTTSRVFKESVFCDEDSLVISGVRTDIRLVSSYSDWKDTVLNSEKNGYKAIILGLYQRIFRNGEHVPIDEVIGWTSKNTPVPIFAFWEMAVGKGLGIGGMVLSGEVQGRAAGEIVLDILDGKPVSKIKPVIPVQGDFVFSRSELDRWRIRLPKRILERSRIVE